MRSSRDDLLERCAVHESGHCCACLSFGIEIVSVTIANNTPDLKRGHYRQRADLAVECLGTMCLAGPAAERCYVGTITDGSDQVDLAMARDCLARRLHPVQIGAVLARLQTAADSLVRTPWAKDRIRIIAAALLQHGTLTGDEIGVMIAADARTPLHAVMVYRERDRV